MTAERITDIMKTCSCFRGKRVANLSIQAHPRNPFRRADKNYRYGDHCGN